MSPVCTNCNGSDFVWANELKTGMTGASLALRARGEVPLGARICRTCGHAELFLRDISILHQPHTWRQGEFIPIVSKPVAKAPIHHAGHPPAPPPSEPTAPPAPAPIPPPPPAPVPVVVSPPEPPAPEPQEPIEATAVPEPAESTSAKAKTVRRRATKSKT